MTIFSHLARWLFEPSERPVVIGTATEAYWRDLIR